ncbi:MAG: hypothetical protein M3Y33_06825 [Actinomycetota bacterium]|nr:hypothetical protein [Actinomycetota bacterium]
MAAIRTEITGCSHREDYAVSMDLRNDLLNPDGTYGGPIFRKGPDGYVIFAHEKHEAAFLRANSAHADPCNG